MARKHCGKRRNCSSRAISPFSHSVFKRLVLQTHKNQGLFGKGLNSFIAILDFHNPDKNLPVKFDHINVRSCFNKRILNCLKLKAFADHETNVVEIMEFVYENIENIASKGEILSFTCCVFDRLSHQVH